MNIKTRYLKSAALSIIGAFAFATASLADWKPGDKIVLRHAASQPVHSIYVVNAGHKAIIEREVPGVRLELTATQGGVENARLLQAGEVESANGNSTGAYSVYHGKFLAEGEAPYPDLLGWFPGYTADQGIIVNADSGFGTFRDLLGKRIALGPVGSGAEATVTQGLEAMGYSDADFANVLRTDPRSAFSALAAGNVDAVLWGTAHPASAIVEQITTRGVKLLSYDQADLAKVGAAYPFYHAARVVAGTYEGQDEDIYWIGSSVHNWINRSVPDDLVYAMTKAMWENRDELVERHPSQSPAFLNEDIVRQQAALLPFHPGADRYFKEIGILR
jgi:TRAP transporter TAXI family solute receptor